jgi:deazaflavin-dependent oxidoreductase (nitroreductase family)
MPSPIGASTFGVWAIKHLISPLHRLMYRVSGGRIVLGAPSTGPILLLVTTGRRSGKQRTTPVFYLRDGERIIICNANPGFERTNPWVINLRAHPAASVQVGPHTLQVRAHEAAADEIETYWPRLVAMWPAYQTHFDRSGQRAIFILDPI